MKTHDSDREDLVRDEILRAARELFQTYGLTKTTMEDIAEAAGKEKSTLCYYFKNKEEVFRVVAGLEFADVMETIGKGVKWVHSAEEKLRLFFTIRNNAIRCKARLYPPIFKGTKNHMPLFRRIQRESNTAEVKMLKALLLEGIASGEFKGIKKKDCAAIAIIGVTALHGLDLNLLLDGRLPSAEARLAVITDIFMKGLR